MCSIKLCRCFIVSYPSSSWALGLFPDSDYCESATHYRKEKKKQHRITDSFHIVHFGSIFSLNFISVSSLFPQINLYLYQIFHIPTVMDLSKCLNPVRISRTWKCLCPVFLVMLTVCLVHYSTL